MTTAADLRFLPGVGPARAALLAAAGITTPLHLVLRPTRCLAAAPDEHTSSDALPLGQPVQIRARIERVTMQPFGRRRTLTVRCLRADNTPLVARFFNAGFLRERFPPGEWFLFEGRSDAKQRNTLNHPRFTHLRAGVHDATEARSGCPVSYQPPAGLSEAAWRKLVDYCLDHHLGDFNDPLKAINPTDFQQAVLALHRPSDPDDHERARRLMAERECLALVSILKQRRASIVASHGQSWPWSPTIRKRALARLPFELTAAQAQALEEITTDLQSPHPMYRLLHGDVGSGKTAVALCAALAVIAGGGQVLWLAPTAILAEQHRSFCARCLHDSRVEVALLTGQHTDKERAQLLDELASGKIHLLIGTHALLEERVHCQRLGLAIIDEQHKFGVDQRARLLASGNPDHPPPDLLALSATPIPRTLCLTLFGDLAVSRISESPPNRGTISTTILSWRLPTLVNMIVQTVADQGRIFVVTPLREAGEHLRVPNATDLANDLTQHLSNTDSAITVALIHGAMRDADKHHAIEAFASGQAHVLVGTTVIEVGIDIPEATAMAIVAAERFGLAQLHQLRGRIGRGGRNGTCTLFVTDPTAATRLQILEQTTDGFRIAEADLADRGPGDILGTRQHGLPELRFTNLAIDADLLSQAHNAFEALQATELPALAHLRQLFLPDVDGTELSGG